MSPVSYPLGVASLAKEVITSGIALFFSAQLDTFSGQQLLPLQHQTEIIHTRDNLGARLEKINP